MDAGQMQNQAELDKIERELRQLYSRAAKDLEAKMNEHFAKYEKKDKMWRQLVKEGKRSEAEYVKWRKGQLAIGQRWQEMLDNITGDLANTHRIAMSVISGHLPEVYANAHNYGFYECDLGTGFRSGISFTMYDKHTVERILRDNPKLYHDPGKSTLEKILTGKLERWEKARVQGALLQGILQGESMDKIAKRIARVTDGDKRRAILTARTAVNGAENAGRVDSYKDARSMGINVKKEWLAVIDGRTRHSHRLMHEEVQDVDEPFSNGCRFPGDPEGEPEEIYNCRCTVKAVVMSRDGSRQFGNRALETDSWWTVNGNVSVGDRDTHGAGGKDPLALRKTGMTYDEWRKAKVK